VQLLATLLSVRDIAILISYPDTDYTSTCDFLHFLQESAGKESKMYHKDTKFTQLRKRY